MRQPWMRWRGRSSPSWRRPTARRVYHASRRGRRSAGPPASPTAPRSSASTYSPFWCFKEPCKYAQFKWANWFCPRSPTSKPTTNALCCIEKICKCVHFKICPFFPFFLLKDPCFIGCGLFEDWTLLNQFDLIETVFLISFRRWKYQNRSFLRDLKKVLLQKSSCSGIWSSNLWFANSTLY